MTSSQLRKAAFALALGVTGLTLYSADAQQPGRAAPPAAPGAQPAQPGSPNVANLPRPIRAKQLLGAKINIQNNTAIGTVDDIILSDSGDVEYLVVLTSDNKMVSVPWPATTWGADYKSATVNITPEQFKVVPTYNATSYPQWFTPTYRNEVYKYYGVTPGQFRRLERRINRP